MKKNRNVVLQDLTPLLVGVFVLLLSVSQVQAAITFVGSNEEPSFPASGVGNSRGTSVTVDVPALAEIGDFMLAVMSVKGRRSTIDSTQTGWLPLENIDQDPTMGVFYRFADSDDADGTQGSYTFTWNDNKEHVGSIIVYRGVDSTIPIVDNESGKAKSNTPTAPVANRGGVVNTMVVRVMTQKDTDNQTLADFWPLPSNTDNERVEVHWTRGRDDKTRVSLSVSDRVEVASGSTPTAVLSSGINKEWAAATIVLRPSVSIDFDFGDAPVSYGDVSHQLVSTLYIGPTEPDHEGSTQGYDGVGDDNDGNNDEDGVTFTATGGVTPQEVSAQVSVLNDTGADAYACAWLDENLDGTFDASEAGSCVSVADNNGSPTAVNFTWTGLPETQGTTYARFRLCSDLNICSGPSNTPTIMISSETVTGSDIFTDGSGTSCVTPVVKTFTIVDSFTISDVDLTLNITHTYRGDFNIFLQSPSGTVVNLTTRESGGGADNINVVFDDEAATNYVDDNSNHSPPPVPRVPENLLNAFDGEDSAGTWTLSMCDSWEEDFGNFDSATLDIVGPSFGGPALTGEVEDYRIDFDFRPTAVTIGKVELSGTRVTDFLTGLGVEYMDRKALLALLHAWDLTAAAALSGDAGREEILTALRNYLDPDGDTQVAVLAWDTLEERGTIGFYVHRREGENGDWIRINDDMLPGLITAPMGGEYQLVDPEARINTVYQYHLIEQEATGTTRSYGPYTLEMR